MLKNESQAISDSFIRDEPFSKDLDQICGYRSLHHSLQGASSSFHFSKSNDVKGRHSVSLHIPLLPILIVSDSLEKRMKWNQCIAEINFQTYDCSFESLFSFSQDYPADCSLIILDASQSAHLLTAAFQFLNKAYPFIPVLLLDVKNLETAPKEILPHYLVGSFSQWEEGMLIPLVQFGLKMYKTIREKNELCSSVGIPVIPINLLGGAPRIKTLCEEIEFAASQDGPVFLEAEWGTRQDIVASQIHLQSSRSSHHFDVLQVDSIIQTFLEPYLFGQEPNTHPSMPQGYVGKLELLNHGTLLLNQVEYFAPTIQTRIGQLIKSKSLFRIHSAVPRMCDTRIIASSALKLSTLKQTGVFQEDWFDLFSAITVHVPPLREIKDCIPNLVVVASQWVSESIGKKPPVFSDAAIGKMLTHCWPGNSVEFELVMKRAILGNQSGIVGPEEIAFDCIQEKKENSLSSFVGQPLEIVEKQFIIETMNYCQGNKGETARLLGISEKTLYNKLKGFDTP